MRRNKIKRVVVLLAGCTALCATSAFPQKASTSSPSPVAAARAEISRGQLETAENALWGVLSTDPNHPEALTLLGIIRGRQKRYPEAEALLRRALQLDPTLLVARRNLASAMIAQNNPDAAIEQYKEIVRLAPLDYEGKLALSRLYSVQGQFTDALSILDSIPKDRLPPAAIPLRAASLLALGRRADAAAMISR